MRRIVSTILVAGIFLAPISFVKADDQADAKAVIEKAIKAIGAEKLAKIQAMTMKMKGKFYGMGGDGIAYTGEFKFYLPNRSRSEITAEANGMKFTSILVYNGDKGWISTNGEVKDADKDQVEEAKEESYGSKVVFLYPLLEKEFALSPLGESKVSGQEAVGVKVVSKGHRDINLFFDKKTNYLIKSETNVKEVMEGGTGKEVSQETLYEDYKDIDGVKQAHKVIINRDGKKYVDGEMSDAKLLEKLDDSVFAKP